MLKCLGRNQNQKPSYGGIFTFLIYLFTCCTLQDHETSLSGEALTLSQIPGIQLNSYRRDAINNSKKMVDRNVFSRRVIKKAGSIFLLGEDRGTYIEADYSL